MALLDDDGLDEVKRERLLVCFFFPNRQILKMYMLRKILKELISNAIALNLKSFFFELSFNTLLIS